MSIRFRFEEDSVADGVTTRTLSVGADPTVVTESFRSFELRMQFDPSVVTLISQDIAVDDRSVFFRINPNTAAQTSASGLVVLAGFTQDPLEPDDYFFVVQYQHAEGADPAFSFSNLLLDEQTIIADAVEIKESAPEFEGAPEAGDPPLTVSEVVASSGGFTLYGLTNGQLGVSSQAAVVGGSLAASDVTVLQQTAGVPFNAQTFVSQGGTTVALAVAGQVIGIDLGLANGAITELEFSTTSGVLTSSSTTSVPGEPPVEEPTTELDGINTGTGVVETQGVEVSADTVKDLLPAASTGFVTYRQLLGDGVALETQNRDGSLSGRVIGDPDARLSQAVDNGTTALTVDLPAGVSLSLLGLASPTGFTGAISYLNRLVDQELPATDPSLTEWNGALKRAIAKAAVGQSDQNVDLDVITPTGTNRPTDQLQLTHTGDAPGLAAINLSQTDALVNASGYDALVAVGPGRLSVSGAAGVDVYGDTWGQTLQGGSGADVLSGGGGSDVLTGGLGQDVFELGFAGTTVITDLAAEDTVMFDLFGVSSVDQLNARIQSVGPGQTGLRVQFDSFAVELVGYSDLSQFQSDIAF